MTHTRRARIRVTSLAVAALVGGLAEPSLAQSPTGSPAPEGSAVPVVASCARLAGLLPSEVDGATLSYTVQVGAETVEPDTVADPLLATLGLALDAMCQVTFSYEDPNRTSQILQIAGADPEALPLAVIAFFIDLFGQFERPMTASTGTIGGRTVTILTSVEAGAVPTLYFYPLGDAMLIGTDAALLEVLLPVLPPAGGPIPDVTAPPMHAPSPSPPVGSLGTNG